MDMTLEVIVVPVSDVERAKDFYADKVGFKVDTDAQLTDDFRVVQLTPPGSGCSIAIGQGLTGMEPGSLDNLQMVVADAEVARDTLRERGIEVSEIDDQPWGSFIHLADPDGNRWAIQQITPRTAA